MTELCIKLIATKVGVSIAKSQIAHVELKYLCGNESAFTKSIFARFSEHELRRKIWENRKQAEIVKVFMEEWLTDSRTKIMKKCKRLLSERIIEDVRTDDGDIIVLYKELALHGGQALRSRIITCQEELTDLLAALNMKKEQKKLLDPQQLVGNRSSEPDV